MVGVAFSAQLSRVLARQQLNATASHVRPAFTPVGSHCLRGPETDRTHTTHLHKLGQLLELCYGFSGRDGSPTARRAPSAGGMYPTEFVCLTRIDSNWVQFAYDFGSSAFRECSTPPYEATAQLLSLGPDDTAIIFVSTAWRTIQRYGFRGYRYCLIDTGSALGNLVALAGALNSTVDWVDGPFLGEVEAQLGIPSTEFAVGAAIINGLDQLRLEPLDNRAGTDADSNDILWCDAPVVATELERIVRLDRNCRAANRRRRCSQQIGSLQETVELIDRRRSARRFQRGALPAEAVAALDNAVHDWFGSCPPVLREKTMWGWLGRSRVNLRTQLVPTAVDVIELGSDDDEVAGLFGGQPMLAHAELFLVFGIDRVRIADDMQSVRALLLESGMLATTLSLAAVRAGIGHTIVGGFDDIGLGRLFGSPMTPLVVVAFGALAPEPPRTGVAGPTVKSDVREHWHQHRRENQVRYVG